MANPGGNDTVLRRASTSLQIYSSKSMLPSSHYIWNSNEKNIAMLSLGLNQDCPETRHCVSLIA